MIIVKKIIFKKIIFKKIILFSADWCFPCKNIKKNIKKIFNKIFLLFFVINVENHNNFCENQKINMLPTLKIIFNKIKKINGVYSVKNILKNIIN